MQPPVLDAAFKPIAIVPRRLLRLGAHHEARRIFDERFVGGNSKRAAIARHAASSPRSKRSQAASTNREVRYSPKRLISLALSTRKVSDG